MRPLLFAAAMFFAADRRVAIVTSDANDPIVGALKGELGTLGFESEVHLERGEDFHWTEVRALGQSEGVAAAIWISPEHDEVVIWVDDRGNGRAIVRTLPTGTTADGEEVIVLRAVELLRASLREVDARTATPPPPLLREIPPQRQADARERDADTSERGRTHWYADLGPAVAGAAGGVGASLQIAASLRFMPHRFVGGRIAAVAPTRGPQVSTAQGSTRVSIAHVVAGPYFAFRPLNRTIQPGAGLGLGVSIVRLDGKAAPPLVGRTDTIVGFTGRIDAGVAFAFSARFALRLDGAIGVTGPMPQIAFDDRTVARWGQPYGLGVLAVQVRFGQGG